jgi:hypothetical protein
MRLHMRLRMPAPLFTSFHHRFLSQLLHLLHPLPFTFLPLLRFLLHLRNLILQMLSLLDELFLGGP